MPEQSPINSICVLTSGGDCAGLNAAIRAIVQRGIQNYGVKVLGIHDGTLGLMSRPVRYRELTLDVFTGQILRMGGTILGTTNKGDPFAYPMDDGKLKDRSGEFVDGYRQLGIDGMIGIGGDGSLDILSRLTVQGGIPFIGIPKTIDNDVPQTEFSIGFSTAVNSAVDALDHLQPTAASHDRVMILEVMGRDAGHIALNAGIAGGADVIVIPEIPYEIDAIADKINAVRSQGRNHSLVVVSEAAKARTGRSTTREEADGKVRYGGVGERLAQEIAETTGAETRVTTLGHVQRGGIPDSHDRIVASAFGVRAVDLLMSGKTDRMVAWQNRQIVDVPLDRVIGKTRTVNLSDTLVETARGLGICLGEGLGEGLGD